MRIITRGIAILLGAVFLVSGWLKGLDPYGTSLKVDEYVNLFQLHFLEDVGIVLAVLLCALELFVGLLLLFGLYQRLIACITFMIMLGFTVVTAYLAFNPYSSIQECGCFGEAVSLTNTETFAKNIVLLLLSGIYTFLLFKKQKPNKPNSFIKKMLLPIYLLLFAVAIPLYSVVYLPPFDFLAFNRGEDLLSDSKFSIFNADFKDVKDSLLLNANKPIFAVVTQQELSSSELNKLSSILAMHKRGDVDCFVLANTEQKTDYGVVQYYVDGVTLKSMIRAKSGVVLIDEGHILGKWNLKQNSFIKLKADELEKLIVSENNVSLRYWIAIVLGLLIGLLLFKSENKKYI